MKTVRRLYFYAVALISLEVVLWGLITLLRSIIDQTIGGGAEALASALALILVGLPIFLFHWLWMQRTAGREAEERSALLRAVFLYAAEFGTLIPVFQNVLAFLDRVLLQLAHLSLERALLGGAQTLADNLIAVLMNGLVALYFWSILQGDWKAVQEQGNLTDVRRLYRYLWVLYSLLMTVFGVEQILLFLFYVPSDVLGALSPETVINGLALTIGATPVWVYAWRVVQQSLEQDEERTSNLRLAVLYLLALGGVGTVLTTAAMVIYTIVARLLGAEMTGGDFLHAIGGPISVGVPLGAVWAYYGTWLWRQIETWPEAARQSAGKRPYFYLLSAAGLGSAFTGLALLLRFFIDISTGGGLLNDTLRTELSSALCLILAWLPLWLLTWRPMQREAFLPSEVGDHARQSVLRKVYLYLALFAGVIGGMSAAGALVFTLLKALLGAPTDSNFLSTVLNDLQLLVLFAILLLYHLSVLRGDNARTADVLAGKQKDFPVLIFDAGGPFAPAQQAALAAAAPQVPVTVASQNVPGSFKALLVQGSRLLQAPDWVRTFSGKRIIVPDDAAGVIWAGGVRAGVMDEAAQAVRQLAEEGEVRERASGGSAWRVIVNIAAVLFGLELLAIVIGLVFTVFTSH